MAATFDEQGFAVHERVLAARDIAPLVACFADARAGDRDGLEHAAVRTIAGADAVRSLVEPVLGRAAVAIRATLFDKTPRTNWLVAWHQDRVVPVQQRIDVAGYRAWSQKHGQWFVEPPLAVLENLLAVRLDLDGSDERSGGLRVVPGSHRHGVLTPAAITERAAAGPVVQPAVPAGGALCLRPLLLHASSRAVAAPHRRIVHLEFAPGPLPEPLAFAHAIAGASTPA